jgi:hypothetical protein
MSWHEPSGAGQQNSVVHGERLELYEALRTIRGFAEALDAKNRIYMVFSNKTLEEMTMKMWNRQDMIDNVCRWA